MIAYFFLGPLMLLAKKWTPFQHPFVRYHAKKSSLILIIAIILLSIGFFIKPLFAWSIFGFSLWDTFLILYMSILIIVLLFWAYQAYHGKKIGKDLEESAKESFSLQQTTLSDEEKIRILWSFLPFIGIFIAGKYQTPETRIGRKVGSALMFLIILAIVLFGGVSSIVFLLTIISIAIFVITGVFLFVKDQFMTLALYEYIPSYHQIEAIFMAAITSVTDFFRIAFWGEKRENFQEKYKRFLWKYERIIPPDTPYWTYSWIFAVPFVNLLTIPSFFREKYAIYRGLIAEGFTLTLFSLIILFFVRDTSFLLFLLFPICTLSVYAGNNVHVRAPFTSIAWFFMELFHKSEQKIQSLKGEWEQTTKYTYETEKAYEDDQKWVNNLPKQ